MPGRRSTVPGSSAGVPSSGPRGAGESSEAEIAHVGSRAAIAKVRQIEKANRSRIACARFSGGRIKVSRAASTRTTNSKLGQQNAKVKKDEKSGKPKAQEAQAYPCRALYRFCTLLMIYTRTVRRTS